MEGYDRAGFRTKWVGRDRRRCAALCCVHQLLRLPAMRAIRASARGIARLARAYGTTGIRSGGMRGCAGVLYGTGARVGLQVGSPAFCEVRDLTDRAPSMLEMCIMAWDEFDDT